MPINQAIPASWLAQFPNVACANEAGTWNELGNFVGINQERYNSCLIRTQIGSLPNQLSGLQNNISGRIYDATSLLITNAANNVLAIGQNIQSAANGTNQYIYQISNYLDSQINQSQSAIQNQLNSTNDYLARGISNTAETTRQNINNSTNILQQALNTATGGVSNVVLAARDLLGNKIDRISSDIESRVNGLLGSIGSVIENKLAELVRTIENLWQIPLGFLEDKLGDLWRFILNKWGFASDQLGEQLDKVKEIIENVAEGEYRTWDSFHNDLMSIGSDETLILKVTGILGLIPLIYDISKLSLKPFSDNLQHLSNERARTTLLSPPDLLNMVYKELVSLEQFKEVLGKQGFTNSDITRLYEASRPLLNPEQIRLAYLRGYIDEATQDDALQKFGFRESTISTIKELYSVIPPANDLIRMAVREVFSPELAQTYGLFDDFPQDFIDYAKQQGISEFWSRNYWAAHWELPSVQMGYSMFHRGIIDRNGLDVLLKSLDIMPYWREKLTQLSYNPLTRVDVRRMYGFGVLNEQEVYQSYLNIGYSPQDATRLKDFTILYENANDDDEEGNSQTLTRTVIESAYKTQVIDRTTAYNRLVSIGYSATDANLLLDIVDRRNSASVIPDRRIVNNERLMKSVRDAYVVRLIPYSDAILQLTQLGLSNEDATLELTIADLEYTSNLKEALVKEVKQLYIDREIDANGMLQILVGQGFTSNEVEKITRELLVFRDLRGRKLTEAQYTKAKKNDIITTEQYIEFLEGLGYSDTNIAILLALNVGDEEVN